jgi:hypothetical protein
MNYAIVAIGCDDCGSPACLIGIAASREEAEEMKRAPPKDDVPPLCRMVLILPDDGSIVRHNT